MIASGNRIFETMFGCNAVTLHHYMISSSDDNLEYDHMICSDVMEGKPIGPKVVT